MEKRHPKEAHNISILKTPLRTWEVLALFHDHLNGKPLPRGIAGGYGNPICGQERKIRQKKEIDDRLMDGWEVLPYKVGGRGYGGRVWLSTNCQ